MTRLLSTSIGRLRLIGILEGISFLVLLCIAMPVKYMLGDPSLVRTVGMAHGVLFVMFVIYTLGASISYNWKFSSVTLKLLVASVFPLGTFYVDKKILSKMPH
jgi:integral membrane protein